MRAARSRSPRRALLCLGLSSLAACSITSASTTPLTPSTAERIVREAANERVEIESGPLGDPRAREQSGYLLGVWQGSWVVRADHAPSPRAIPLAATQAITTKSRGLGAIEGALFGLLPGLVGGIAFGSALESMQCSSDTSQRGECKSYALTMGLTLGASTAAIGALIGLARGHRTTYKFPTRAMASSPSE
jgi:hypothetical protein